jgi:hypothetical protein
MLYILLTLLIVLVKTLPAWYSLIFQVQVLVWPLIDLWAKFVRTSFLCSKFLYLFLSLFLAMQKSFHWLSQTFCYLHALFAEHGTESGWRFFLLLLISLLLALHCRYRWLSFTHQFLINHIQNSLKIFFILLQFTLFKKICWGTKILIFWTFTTKN